MSAAQHNAMESMPVTRHASFEKAKESTHASVEHSEQLPDPETEEALNQTALSIELLLEQAPIARVAKNVIRADEELQQQMAAYALEASRRYHMPVASLDDTEWNKALASAIEQRQHALEAKGYQFDEEGTMLEFGKRPEGMDALDSRELTILRGVLEYAATQESNESLVKQREPRSQSVDKLGSLLAQPALEAMDPTTKHLLAGDAAIRRELSQQMLREATLLGVEAEQLRGEALAKAVRKVAEARFAELRRQKAPIDSEGNLIPGKRISAAHLEELKKTQSLIEIADATSGKMQENLHQLEGRTPLKPLARPARPAATPTAKPSPSIWNRIGKSAGKFFAGLGIWLAGTSGGEWDQSAKEADRNQEPSRPLPAYARSEQSAADLPSSTIEFTEDESDAVMREGTRPTEVAFADDEVEPMDVDFREALDEAVASAVKLSGDHNRSFDRLSVPQEASTESRRGRADIEVSSSRAKSASPHRETAKRPVGVKRATAASKKFDVDAFRAAGLDATRGMVGTPERTRATLDAMRDGKRPLPPEAQDLIDTMRTGVDSVLNKPIIESSPNKGGAANDLLKTIPKAPGYRKEVPKSSVFKKPVMSRAAGKSRGAEALRSSQVENKKSLESIDQQIDEVRAAQKRGDIGLREAIRQIAALRDLK